jgi:hypothetical protein
MHWPGIVLRVIGYPILAAVLYFLGLAPVGYLLSARAPALDRALNVCGRPVEWMFEGIPSIGPLFIYYVWWYRLPGGPEDRVKAGYVYPRDL